MLAVTRQNRSLVPVSAEKGRFGRRLTQLREKAGLSVYALAKLADLPHITVSRIETGAREPAWPTAVKLAEALGVSLAEFDANHSAEGPAEPSAE